MSTIQVTPSSETQYFATLPIDELIPALNSKVSEFYDFVLKYRFLDRWRRTYLAYYGQSQSGSSTDRLNQTGMNGEEWVLKCNDYRSLLQNLLTMTTSNRPAVQPKAMNTDSASMNQTLLASTVLDYYAVEKHLEETLKDAVEFALFGGEGLVVLNWNATLGKVYTVDPTTHAPVYDGDLEFKAFHPIDVIRECWNENATTNWKIVREFKNKWDLAAKYPALANDIIKLAESSDFMRRYSNINYNSHTSVDYLPVFTFYHEPTESVPNGRMVQYLGDYSLTDGPLPYKHVPVYRISPAKWHGTSFGYTVAYDLLGIQQNLDALNSIVATNQMNYGQQNVLLPRGNEYNVYALAQGLNGIEYDPKLGKPEPLNLLATPPEIINNIERLEKKQETISGVNQVARGNIDRDMSGAALALIAAQAVQFNNGLQQSYNLLVEGVFTGIIEILQMYALTPRIASIAGKSNRFRVKEFKGDDLNQINRVSVEQVNPISQTAAGRQTIADTLMKTGLIKTPEHYLEVLTTGRLDSLYEHETSQIMLIRSENEDLSDGKKPIAVITDQHKLHIQEHSTVLDSPEARSNPQIVELVTAHIQEHIQLLRTTDPALLQLLGEQPLPPSPAPGSQLPPGPQQQANGPQGPQLPNQLNPTPPVVQQAQQIKQPSMPNLPQMPKQAPPDAQAAYQQIKANSNQ
jgi:hypothetical protein